MSRLGQRAAAKVATSRLKPVAVLLVRALPGPTFAVARRLRVGDRATDELINEATAALRAGKHRQGRGLARTLISHVPLSSRQRGVLEREIGRGDYERMRFEQAVANLTSAVAQLPSDKEAAELLIHASAESGDPSALEAALRRLRPSDLDPGTLNDAVTVLAEAGAWRTVLDTVSEGHLSESSLLHIAGLAERFADADFRSDIDEAVHEQLDSARVWYERGRQLETEGEPTQALVAYVESLRRPNPSAATWYRAGRLHLQLGDAETAQSCLGEAVRQKPHRTRWRRELGRALLELGRHSEAVEELTRALQIGMKEDRRLGAALARARRRAGVAAPGVRQETPDPPELEDLNDIDVGIAAPVTEEALIGWVLDLPGAEHRIQVEVNGIPVARARATTPVRLADGRSYLRFRRTIRDLWSYLGDGDVIQITVSGEPLPIVGAGDRMAVDMDRPSCVASLEKQLERGYVLNKYGRIRRSIRHNLRWQDAVIALFHELRSDVREAIDADLFPFYGTLLGAIREGDFLGHDDDFDTAYISSGTTPTEVHDEFLRLCEHLIRKGHRIHARAWHIWVDVPGTRSRLDIFFCWFDPQDRFQVGYGYHGSATERSDSFRVDRLVRLAAHELLAPSNAEELLAQLYGPSWRKPDPGFGHKSSTRVLDERYRVPRDLRNEVYWRQFYRDHQVTGGSTFAEWVASRFPAPARLIEFGCGSGRDSVYFARLGYEVFASDRSQQALDRAIEAQLKGSPRRPATFRPVDVSDEESMKRFLEEATEELPDEQDLIVYLRFVLHSVPAAVQDQLFEAVSNHLDRSFTLCLEFRTLEDEARDKIYGDHYRRYVDHEALADELATGWGFRIDQVEASTGLSPFRGEDPHLARIVARRERRCPDIVT